jgi:GlpG protein
LGGCLEQKIGPVRWLVFFLAAAWVSSALQLLTSGSMGIGMSGVGYALFGFGWVARRRMAEFDRVLDDRTVQIFLVWLVACMVLTAFNVMQIANAAHIAGLLFGAATAAVFVLKRQVWLTGPALAGLIALSFVPLYWCPLSVDWTANKATEAHERHDYARAISFYQQSLRLGQKPEWVWYKLALIYGQQGDTRRYTDAIRELRKVDPKAAAELEAGFGSSAKKGAE